MKTNNDYGYYSNILNQLEERGRTGLDLSPGDQLSKEAAQIIKALLKEIGFLNDRLSKEHF